MSIATDSDLQIQAAVQAELEWTPDVDAAGIGVAVEDGAVTLTGEVDNYAERLAAKHAALRLRGVRAVVDAMSVHPRSAAIATETDIAKEVERALRTAVNVPATVQATLDGHHVTLTGEVQWDFQRVAAKRAVQYLRGVYSVNNMITLTARPSAEDAEERIKKAITRNAQLDATSIEVSAKGNTVTLTGSVASWAERRQAERAAWASPHVTDVVNRIQVRPF
ncbi:BON domain-containing protein [Microbacterium sp.]|uniref:BON domain-containing protein n=1 Tax=Microbacterium sp. TaxID=51671 RepID=UPI000927D128|nr:BON domain-containing protein [Microbacterium sp.]MBN9191602.1 BON domain-containing protein [Microbacterium sp.]OJU69403.1 MAG: transporter [Microbacterium sp. 70-38]